MAAPLPAELNPKSDAIKQAYRNAMNLAPGARLVPVPALPVVFDNIVANANLIQFSNVPDAFHNQPWATTPGAPAAVQQASGTIVRMRTRTNQEVKAWIADFGNAIDLKFYCHGWGLSTAPVNGDGYTVMSESMFTVLADTTMATRIAGPSETLPAANIQNGDIIAFFERRPVNGVATAVVVHTAIVVEAKTHSDWVAPVYALFGPPTGPALLHGETRLSSKNGASSLSPNTTLLEVQTVYSQARLKSVYRLNRAAPAGPVPAQAAMAATIANEAAAVNTAIGNLP